ncbi:FtsQ-type POTRA domain-containing protein [Zymomonas sp.]|uniref:cell division protein FtsQ/DivIB n=1 Tax=Zymomonas sp. TaxID=2068624 RepID=UPI0025D4B365|nr:FtsQ-type POTRA domain-containing protein [Zymomonas sp.]MCA1956871.1 FtsQ-type POTRA domain-containing protein [Zymomonas sp.]
MAKAAGRTKSASARRSPRRHARQTGATIRRPKRPIKSNETIALPKWLAFLSHPFLKQMAKRLLLILVIVGFLAGLWAARWPQLLATKTGEYLGRQGFSVSHVEIVGLHHMDRQAIYAIASTQQNLAMPLVDLNAIRDRLLRFGWIEDARVSRRWPDTLVVDIVERNPAAVWQYHGHLRLVDNNGIIISDVDPHASPDLPLVIGAGANLHLEDLGHLLEAAPSLKPMIDAASWIGNRRWDLHFASGETLSLPEGNEAEAALVRFSHINREHHLLERGYVKFDMRVPGAPITARISPEPVKKATKPAKVADPLVSDRI